MKKTIKRNQYFLSNWASYKNKKTKSKAVKLGQSCFFWAMQLLGLCMIGQLYRTANNMGIYGIRHNLIQILAGEVCALKRCSTHNKYIKLISDLLSKSK
ncbi:hypothetical protein BTV98_00330 [Psychrobacter sp. Cmf 22.2]|nr:hypothetical protein BTV98_00330 [Psychrobacter sp. Cmf 22.2]